MPKERTKTPMVRELKHEASIVRCLILGEQVGKSAAVWTAGAVTRIPGEVRARFLREVCRSVVEADVEVEAADSPATREKIGDRIMEIASQVCCEHVVGKIGLPLQPRR